MTVGYPNPAANYVVAIMLPVIGTVLVGVRFALRLARKMSLKADDWFCLPALVRYARPKLSGAFSPTAITPQNAIPTILKIGISIEDAYIFLSLCYLALGCTKLSILFFYRRIFRGRIFNIVTWIVIITVTLWMLIFSVTWLLSCGNHPRVLWTQFAEINSRCLNVFDQMIAGAVVDWILDIAVLVLPCAMVWQLQMPFHQKIYVMGIFLTGIISFVAGILRFVVCLAVANFGNSAIAAGNYSSIDIASMAGHTLGVSRADWLGMSTVSLFWAMVEVGVALIAINLPALRPGETLRSARLYRWLSGLSSSLRLGSSASSSRKASASSQRSGEKKLSPIADGRAPMQGPWPSLATQVSGGGGGWSEGEEETWAGWSDGGVGVAVEMGKRNGGIYYERDYQVTESLTRIPTHESDFRRRYEELFPPASAYVVTEPKERV
ncbi:MAG: hypothetical protein M1822_002485 [Bathelium mastoideum]|nr:MAG: hypothetical protein M1822_002485 [Bathelium mastoideum]